MMNIKYMSFNVYQLYKKLQSLQYKNEIQSNLYIKGAQGNMKMRPSCVVALYIQYKIICTMHLWGK